MFPDGLAAEYIIEGRRVVDVDDRNVGATKIRGVPSSIPLRAISPSVLHDCAKLLNAELERFQSCEYASLLRGSSLSMSDRLMDTFSGRIAMEFFRVGRRPGPAHG